MNLKNIKAKYCKIKLFESIYKNGKSYKVW